MYWRRMIKRIRLIKTYSKKEEWKYKNCYLYNRAYLIIQLLSFLMVAFIYFISPPLYRIDDHVFKYKTPPNNYVRKHYV